MSTIDVRGVAVPVAFGGAEDAPPLLWVHGEGLSAGWREVHDRLATRHRVIVPTLPGFGGTELPAWVDGVDDLALFLVDLCAALGEDEVLVAGESLGGWIAAVLATWRPRLVARLALLGTLGVRSTEPMPDLFIKAGPEALSYLSATRPADAVDPLVGDIDLATSLWIEQATQARLMWERPYDRKLAQRAHHLDMDVTVIWGGADRLLTPGHAATVAELFGASEPVIVAGAGHLVSVDAPDACAAAIEEAFA
ncbi:MAG: alpha/beta hydrolase [Acidimicrobiales bacterium]